MEQEYNPGTFIGKYIERCRVAKHPLKEMQIQLLEETLVEAFANENLSSRESIGLNKNSYPRLDTYTLEKVASEGRHKMPQRLINQIKKYRYGDNVPEDAKITDGDALSLYILITDEALHIECSEGFPENLKHVNRKCGTRVGLNALRLLHEYLDVKGLLSSIPATAIIERQNKFLRMRRNDSSDVHE